MKPLPRYPIYIPSKGRADIGLTAKILSHDGVPFRLVVEPQEREAYADRFGEERVLTLPFSNLGQGSIPARNWLWEHSRSESHARHWCMDDNIGNFYRWYKNKRIRCEAGVALAAMEDFVDRYENVAIAGPNGYALAVYPSKPFVLNCHVYSCLLIWNDLPYRWRGRYNEDADLCFQCFSGGWCTVSMRAFVMDKRVTMTMRGGNTDELYAGDGRLKMARSLQRVWPGIVRVKRKYGRPQHSIVASWQKFDMSLKRRSDVNLESLPRIDERGMCLVQKAEIKSDELRRKFEGVIR